MGWKLAAVVQGCASPRLLDTYEPERIAFAQRLVATTERAFQLATSDGPLARWIRVYMLPLVLPAAFSFARMRRFMFRTISQTAIEYRHGALSRGTAGGVHAGDRLPWVRLAPTDGRDDNFAPLTALDWQVHIYGTAAAAIIDTCKSCRIALHTSRWRDEMRTAGLARDAVYLLRPDGYVAFADREASASALTRYLEAWNARSRLGH